MYGGDHVGGWEGCPMRVRQRHQIGQIAGPNGGGLKKWRKWPPLILRPECISTWPILPKKWYFNQFWARNCQITVLPVVMSLGPWHHQLQLLIASKRKKLEKRGWRHLKELKQILSEQHKFCPNWLINSGTVISQSTANSTFLALSQPPTLIAYSF